MSKRVIAQCVNCGKTAQRVKGRSGLACTKNGSYCGTMRVMKWVDD